MSCTLPRWSSVVRIASPLCFLIAPPFAIALACFASEQYAPAQARSESQTATAPSGKISGHVYRADNGEPIAKAIVTLVRDYHRAERMTRTEQDGSYSFTDVSEGPYSVHALRTGFLEGEYHGSSVGLHETILVQAGMTRDNIDIRLDQASVISGRVTDPDGDPVEGFQIFAVRPLYSEGGRVYEANRGEAFTDDKGDYRLTGLAPGNYFVRAGGSGKNTGAILKEGTWAYRTSYYPGSPQIDGAESINVKAGAEVTGINLQVAGSTRHAYTITINVAGVPSGSYPQISVLPGDEVVRDLAPRRDAESGAFTISGVSPGRYTIVARSFDFKKSTYTSAPDALVARPRMLVGVAPVIIEGANATVNIHLADAGEIHGKIAYEKRGKTRVEELSLELVARGGIGDAISEPEPELEIKGDGSFTITNISPGQYFFGLDDSLSDDYVKNVTCEGQDHTLQTFEIEAGTKLADCHVVVAADLGSVTGMVFDGGGKTVPGVFVIAIPQSAATRQNPQYTFTEKTDSDGQVQLKVIPGDYFLFAVRPNDQDSYYALDFAERNLQYAERVSVKSGGTKTVQLKLTTPQ